MENFTVQIKEHGRMNLPRKLRAALGLQEHDDLVFRVREDGSAEVVPASTLARQGSGLFRHLKVEESETDAFLAERRAEADR